MIKAHQMNVSTYLRNHLPITIGIQPNTSPNVSINAPPANQVASALQGFTAMSACSFESYNRSLDLPKDLTAFIGSSTYYIERAKDFSERNFGKNSSYYENYGQKYADRFRSIRSNLSAAGQRWIDKTHIGLQQAI